MTRLSALLSVLSLFPFACSSGSDPSCPDLLDLELPSCEIAAACTVVGEGEAVDLPTCLARASWSSRCDEAWRDAADELTQEGLLYEGDLPESVRSDSPTTFTDAASLDAFVAQWEVPPVLPPVDFETHIVVLAQYAQSSTCGMVLERHGVRVWEGSDAPVEIYAEFADSSGSCGVVCSMSMRLGVLYAVPRARGWAEVCAEVVNSC